jgi:polysaccharide chain length determinant protein (PEP-CTERM system associated)
MNELYVQLFSYLTSIWRRRWYALAIAWLVCGAGWTMVASLPDKYESQARVYVDMDTMLGPLMQGIAVQVNMFEQIDIMQRTLLSRPNLEKVILMTDLDLKISSDEEKDALIEQLKNAISVRQQGRNLFRVAYTDSEPAITKRVVQAVLQIFVESNLGSSRKDMDSARRFLSDQIKDYEKQLELAEARLADFKRKNLGMLPGEGNYYSHMQAMRTQLKRTESQIAEASTVRDELKQQLSSVPQFLELSGGAPEIALTASASDGPESDTQLRIFEMQKVVDNMLTRYTEKHPDVATAIKRLETLKKELAAERSGGPGPGTGGELSAEAPKPGEPGKNVVPNPVYEQLKLQLVQQEAAIAAFRGRAEKENVEVGKWEQMAGRVPQVEAELSRLTRDYEIVKKGYEELRRRQESARLASDMETKAQKVQFRIVDPPKQPLKPSGPNRPLFMAVVLVAGIGAGLAFAFLLGQVNSTFQTVQRLRQTFALPVLGSVTAITSTADRLRRRREMFGFGVVTASLIVAFAGLLMIEVLGLGGLLATVKGLNVV